MTAIAETTAPIATPASIQALHGIPLGMRSALKIMLKLPNGALTVTFPNGEQLRFIGKSDGPTAELQISDFRFVRRAIAGGDVGLGEGYMAGEWTSPDLTALLMYFADNLDNQPDIVAGGPLTRFVHWVYHQFRANTKAQARRNIEAHYDLGNDFYEQWLDPSMTYSSARFTKKGQSLEDAQHEKYRALADSIDLKEDDHVLEIGCGWGGFAEYAARDRGARVTCLTLSSEQQAYARERMEKLQLSDRVDIKLQDYRDETGTYDKVASIEMFEAVGREYWPSFFAKVHDCLKPGGRAGLQIISIRDDLFETYARRTDFIQRYIFPGGVLPSFEVLKAEFARASLSLDKLEAFATDYADTLAEWMKHFTSAWDNIRPLGFDDRFRRMWEFYLAYCEAGFRTGRIDVAQYTLAR
ncbi:class I SAM-dependent methyltransferase [Hyphobacterium sp.]|uniref:class I SAM-dependent methyltransferase n=1 Tax=Hyphobacterium sp. TaxID=2004662 RepID=UPI003B520B42